MTDQAARDYEFIICLKKNEKKKKKGKQPHGWNKSIIKKANFTTMAGSASPFASILSLMASTA